MPKRNARAQWLGGLEDGRGEVSLGSGAFEGAYSFRSRFSEEDHPGPAETNPEELLGAAHAACFSMALAAGLGRAGHNPNYVKTTAEVALSKGEDGFKISRIDLECQADVPGIGQDEFQQQADAAKANCPVSKALAGVDINLHAQAVG